MFDWDDLQLRKCIELVLHSGVLTIRDVAAGEKPFSYTSGYKGPVYVSIKSLIGRKDIIKHLMWQLARKLTGIADTVDFVAGNATGGMIPGWLLSELLGELKIKKTTVPFVYVQTEKGITGICDPKVIKPGSNVVIVDELVNFASTTCDSAQILRKAGYVVENAACLLYYGNPIAENRLKQLGLRMTCLLTLDNLLAYAEKLMSWRYPKNLIDDCRKFLCDPLGWEKEKGLS